MKTVCVITFIKNKDIPKKVTMLKMTSIQMSDTVTTFLKNYDV